MGAEEKERVSMIKAIAMDLDGTLLDNENKVPIKTIQLLEKLHNNGFLIIIATGRPLRTLETILPDCFSHFYWVTSNGAWILKNKKILHRFEMTYEETNRVVDILSCNNLSAHIEADNHFFSDTELKTEIINFNYKPLCEYKGNACMVLAYIGNGSYSHIIEKKLPSNISMTLTNNNAMINIGAKHCEKSNAVNWVLNNENIKIDNLIAFGDDVNDKQLVHRAKYGIAVSNAHIELKKVADFITKSNNEEGVGIILEKILLDDYSFLN